MKGGIFVPPETRKRGFDTGDQNWFSADAVCLLGTAQEEVQWLLDRGYRIGPVTDFVGSHYQLSSRQRSALQRASSAAAQYDKRKASQLPFEAAKDGCLFIDGFNLIILLETALSGSLVILGKDGVYRDLAGVRGSYRLIGETDTALEIIGQCFAELMVPEAVFYLDKPVSNSGRLRNRILEYAGKWNIPVRVELVPNADVILTTMERIVTGDSIILDQCSGWFNLSKKIIDDYVKDAWIIDFN